MKLSLVNPLKIYFFALGMGALTVNAQHALDGAAFERNDGVKQRPIFLQENFKNILRPTMRALRHFHST